MLQQTSRNILRSILRANQLILTTGIQNNCHCIYYNVVMIIQKYFRSGYELAGFKERIAFEKEIWIF